MRELSLCVFGQFNIDAVASSIGRGSNFRLGHNRLRFGGTVANLGKHARDGFAKVTAIFAVGGDFAGDMLQARARDLFDAHVAIKVPETDSGVVLILFEEEGRRIVGPAGACSYSLSAECLDAKCRKLISEADAVVIDGYLLLGENGPDLVCSAIDAANSAGTRSIIDLAPHNLPMYISGEIFKQIVISVDVVVSELQTIAQFFAIDADPYVVSSQLLGINPGLTAILRYGKYQISTNHVISADHEAMERHVGGPEELTKLGYGDRKLVEQLITLLETSCGS